MFQIIYLRYWRILTRYQNNTQKPYYMAEQLEQVKTNTYLLEGDRDLLFPDEKSIQHAKAKLPNLKDVKVGAQCLINPFVFWYKQTWLLKKMGKHAGKRTQL